MPVIQGTGSHTGQQTVISRRAVEPREPARVQPEAPITARTPFRPYQAPSFGGDTARQPWLPEAGTIAAALDALLDDYADYIDNTVSRAIEDYAEHTEELNYYVASFPDDLLPELRERAVEEFLVEQPAE